MCRDPICTVAKVWCCSEHYLWFFDGGVILEVYTAMYCYHTVFSEVDVRLNLMSRGGSYSVSRCVRPWIKPTPEYPFKGIICNISALTCLKVTDFCFIFC